MAVEYKVLSQKDKWLSSKFDPEGLERALNAYADSGWRVKAGDTANFPGFLGERQELLAILERDSEGGAGAMLEYKVLTQKDKWLSSKFDPEKVEQALNAYAEQGWRAALATTASFPGFLGGREELIIILERERA